MRFPRSGFGLLLVCLLLGPGMSEAGPRRSDSVYDPALSQVEVKIGQTYGGATCNLGHDGVPQRRANLLTPPSDRYYLLIEPDQCAECVGTNRARLESATISLYFPVACTVPVIVGVYAVAGHDTCLTPNENVQLCAPQLANLTGTVAGQYHQFTIDIPDSCEITERAFLGFNFFTDGVDCASDTTRPWIAFGNSPCPLCNIWNIFVSPPDKDLCFEDPLGLPVMYASVRSCYTPTIPRSWGEVKSIYYRSPR